MSVSVTITNLAAVATPVTEAYTVLGATGAANDAITIERSVAELDSMRGLKALVDAGTVSVDAVQSSDNVDLLSVPLEQHGVVAGVEKYLQQIIQNICLCYASFCHYEIRVYILL